MTIAQQISHPISTDNFPHQIYASTGMIPIAQTTFYLYFDEQKRSSQASRRIRLTDYSMTCDRNEAIRIHHFVREYLTKLIDAWNADIDVLSRTFPRFSRNANQMTRICKIQSDRRNHFLIFEFQTHFAGYSFPSRSLRATLVSPSAMLKIPKSMRIHEFLDKEDDGDDQSTLFFRIALMVCCKDSWGFRFPSV